MNKLNQYQRAKLKKIIIIATIVAIALIVIFGSIFLVTEMNKPKEISYEDNVIQKNCFVNMEINLNEHKVTRDDKETKLDDEFELSSQRAELLLSSKEELEKYFSGSTFELSNNQGIVTLKNPYQTKTLIVEADEVKDSFDAIEEIKIQDGLYVLKYDTQKRTKAAYEYIKEMGWTKNIQIDEVSIISTINDESQTLYGNSDTGKENVYGVTAMGLNNYKNIINENGNAAQIVIATIGYGAAIDNTYFAGRIEETYFNYINNNNEVKETIPQGSRTLEVIKENTTDNVKILPLVVIDSDGYTTTSAVLQAISTATKKADVICYEFVHKSNYMIKLALKNAFNSNIPVCCVTKNAEDGEEIFPAEDGTTIAVSSVDKDLKVTSYSAKGNYLDFVASSTDVKEIFNSSSTISKWSGAQYSNAQIASAIALIKTYNKDAKIIDIYNTLKSYCKDLGETGKDEIYGHGFPNFSEIKISDIDKIHPELTEVIINDNDWEKTKKVQFKSKDNIKIFGWNITKDDKVPGDWKRLDNIRNTLDITEEITDNSKYYLWVVDTAGNVVNGNFEITKIDNIPPTIKYTIDDSHAEDERYVNINASATDDQSGLHERAYSWDKENWGTANTILKVTKNGTYTLYVRDKLENIAENRITIKSLPEKGIAEIDNGLIIKEISVSDKWEGNKNKEVTIIFNDNLNIKRRKITNADIMPEEFRPNQSDINNLEETDDDIITEVTNDETNTTETLVTTVEGNDLQGHTNLTVTVALEINKKYYIWIEDDKGNVISQGFTIRKEE